MTEKKGNTPYVYQTRREAAFSVVTGVAALAVYGVTLSSIFNPAALALVAGVGAVAALEDQYGLITRIMPGRKSPHEEIAPTQNSGQNSTQDFGQDSGQNSGQISGPASGMRPLGPDTPIAQMVEDISARMGLQTPPPVYVADRAALSRMVLPYGARWILNIPFFQDRILPRVFCASPQIAAIITTDAAMKSIKDPAMMRFIIAHELSHIKTDRKDFYDTADLFMQKTASLLLWGCAGMAVCAAVGLAVPLAGPGIGVLGMSGGTVGTSVAGFMGVQTGVLAGLGPAMLGAAGAMLARFSGGLVAKTASRMQEYRADRNALYITRDLRAAEKVMEYIHNGREPQTHKSKIGEIFSSHPSHKRRSEALRVTFCRVNCYPAVTRANAPINTLVGVQHNLQHKEGGIAAGHTPRHTAGCTPGHVFG